MKALRSFLAPIVLPALSLALVAPVVRAADSTPPASAADLAGRLSALQEDGSSYVRLRLEVKQGTDTSKAVFQLQIKQRRAGTGNDIVYQILWPRERKGESVLLRQAAGHAPSGAVFLPPDKIQPLDASKMKEPLFGSDLSYADVIENFFAWPSQTLMGTEAINGVNCQILESKPGKGGHSIYGSVKSWIDAGRLIPLRVEKFLPSGQMLRRIETTDVDRDDKGHPIPSKFTVRQAGQDTFTVIEGSRIKHDVTFAESEFKPEGLNALTTPRGQ